MSHSSIFSFSTLRLRPPWIGAGLGLALLLIGGAELTLRLLGDRIGQPRLWGDGETSLKVAQYGRFVRENGGVDVLIVGPSYASAGFDPQTMRAAIAERQATSMEQTPRIYNAGLMGRDYPVSAFMLRQEWLRNAKPKLILVGVGPICFNASGNPLVRNTEEFYLAPKPLALHGSAWSRAWHTLLVDYLYLYRCRWRGPKLDEGWWNGEKLLEPDGFHPLGGVYDEAERGKLRNPKHIYRNIWRDYRFGGDSVGAIEEIVALGKAGGARTVLIEMPIREGLFEFPGDGRAAYAAYRGEMAALAERLGVLWIDMQSIATLGDADFKDTDHLNKTGAATFSKMVVAELFGRGVLP